jgi:hypothetical protein
MSKEKKMNRRALNAEATRMTRMGVEWAKVGIKAIGDMEGANPGIGFVVNKKQKRELEAFVSKNEGKKFVKVKKSK